MNSSMPPNAEGKGRRYDATRRRKQAARNRERVLDVAEEILLERGYAETTVSAIARAAEVSPELIYKTFGGKAGLVREIQRRGLQGAGPIPAETRSDAMSASEPDAAVPDQHPFQERTGWIQVEPVGLHGAIARKSQARLRCVF